MVRQNRSAGAGAVSSAGPGGIPLVQVGDVVRIPEAHYLYGSGVLTMRVTDVGADLEKYPRLEWVGLKGVEIRWDGSNGDERQVMVRVGVLVVEGVVGREGSPG